MADNIPELEPCPKCRGRSEIRVHEVDGHGGERYLVKRVQCRECGLQTEGTWASDSDKVEAWNTRAAPKVKPLVWEEVDAGYFSAEEYSIERAISSRLEYDLKVYGVIIATSMAKDAVSALKRKASAHRRERILSALQ